MKTIWKYSLKPEITLQIPKGAQILDVQIQAGSPLMWALVDPDAPKEGRKFKVLGTGHECDVSHSGYVGTWQDGWMVFHLFEVG